MEGDDTGRGGHPEQQGCQEAEWIHDGAVPREQVQGAVLLGPGGEEDKPHGRDEQLGIGQEEVHSEHQLGGGGELGDLAAHQLVQLVGEEGGDDQALLVGERGEELLEEHERWRQAVMGADVGRKELVQLLYQQSLLQKLSSHADGAWQAVHVIGDAVHVVGGVVGVFHVGVGHGARSGCSDGSQSHRQEDFAAN